MLLKNDSKQSSISSNGRNPEVADIFRLYGQDYRKNHNLSFEQLKVMRCYLPRYSGYRVKDIYRVY